ncbi:LysR family transcriptional regulator [Paraburkholderia sp. CNPSo 3274]|uniref:LysR family transcriptional regulator n=1 Tax=Paraburkholderia sp. CNPSo 3274 TaxID=2940932 RepID=UPI0020B7450C|nr:LysR family transcriptional regulator [Paraburkholderia sp. CNPSo 3274]MCP3711226.1 LysR family transcriptional regulator [Paraburkholderia sp. CNPSo 3274]
MSEPDLNLLIALDALLDDGSVVGAARRLGLSASAMSRTLTRLREATGDPLLVRAGRGMVLTSHAQALRERTRNAVREARAVLVPSVTEPDLATLQRTFTIRANDGFVEAFGAPLIAAATAVAPFVRLRFAPKTEKTSAHLREGSADLEIGVLGEMGPEIRVQALFRDRFVGVVRKGHPLALERGPGAERYVAFGHVVASRSGRGSGPVDVALAALGLERTIVAVVPSFPAALAVARASDLIALVPGSFLCNDREQPQEQQDELRESPQSAGIHVFELPVTTEKITVSQMWHPRIEADPVHRWLRQLVLAVCRQRVPL